MQNWYSLDLGDGVDAGLPSTEIKEAFYTAFVAQYAPHDMAIFSRYDLERNIVTMYFSPAAKDVAYVFGATSCERPSMNRLVLEVGDRRRWRELFANQ